MKPIFFLCLTLCGPLFAGDARVVPYGDADAQPFTIAPLGPSRYARERISVE